MNADPRPIPWSVWLWWALVSGVGGALGGVIAGLTAYHILITAPLGSSIAAGVGQWFVVRRHIPNGREWLLHTVIASVVGVGIAMISTPIVIVALSAVDILVIGSSDASVAARSATIGFLSGAIAGAIVGHAQQTALQRELQRQPGWMLVSSLGWGIGNAIQCSFLLLWAADGVMRQAVEALATDLFGISLLYLPILLTSAYALGWLINAGITGIMLRWHLAR